MVCQHHCPVAFFWFYSFLFCPHSCLPSSPPLPFGNYSNVSHMHLSVVSVPKCVLSLWVYIYLTERRQYSYLILGSLFSLTLFKTHLCHYVFLVHDFNSHEVLLTASSPHHELYHHICLVTNLPVCLCVISLGCGSGSDGAEDMHVLNLANCSSE